MQQRSKINDLNIIDWAWVLIQWSPERPSLILIVNMSGELHGHKQTLHGPERCRNDPFLPGLGSTSATESSELELGFLKELC